MISIREAGRKSGASLILLAVAVTATQIIFATLSARGDSWRDRYLSLWTFDGGWYADILQKGYRTTDPPVTAGHQSNVAFFPAYPIVARGVMKVLGLSPGVSLLVTAQLAAGVFWGTLLCFLKKWKISSSVSASVIMLIFCHPAAFYLVVTYADSLFMASILLLLLWGSHAGNSIPFMIGAAVAGYLASATRIVGAPLAALPVVWAWNDLWPSIKTRATLRFLLRRIWPYTLVSLGTAFGTISFFLYCAVRFGYWDLYMRTRAAGWGVSKTDYLAIFALQNFNVSMPRFYKGFISAGHLSHLYVAVLILAVFLIPAVDYWLARRKNVPGFSQRLPFYLAAWLLFFFSAGGSGIAQGSYLGFLRYGFYSHVPLMLAVVHAHRQLRPDNDDMSLSWKVLIFLACALGLALQSHFCHLYSHEALIS
jgi:hypothetical protein